MSVLIGRLLLVPVMFSKACEGELVRIAFHHSFDLPIGELHPAVPLSRSTASFPLITQPVPC